jgi:hypothetical protein
LHNAESSSGHFADRFGNIAVRGAAVHCGSEGDDGVPFAETSKGASVESWNSSNP